MPTERTSSQHAPSGAPRRPGRGDASAGRRSGRSVVVPVMAGLGNALMAVPMVRQLKRARPETRLTVLARIPAAAGIYRRLGEVDEVVLVGRTRGVRRALRRVRQTRPDVCLVPFPSNRWQYAALMLATGARRRIVHGYPCGTVRALGLVPAERVPAVPGIHDVEQNLRLLPRLGVRPDPPEPPEFVLSERDADRARELLGQLGLPDAARFVAVHPGSGRTAIGPAKRWPLDRYGRLARELERRWAMPTVVLEGPDEPGLAGEIARLSRPATALPARVSRVGDAAAVLARSALYVGSDSGLAHLAAAVGKKAIAIFGPADPDRVCPFGCRDLVVQPRDMPCAPCLRYPLYSTSPRPGCASPACARAIEVEQVLAKLERCLGAPGRRGDPIAAPARPARSGRGKEQASRR